MSYNIDSVKYSKGKLYITGLNAAECLKNKDKLPETHFLRKVDLANVEPQEISAPSWQGEGSGYYFDYFKEVLSKTTGNAHLILVWEGGDDTSGLKVYDGVVSEGKVITVVE